MRVLVIGGTQFMGRETALRLVAAGHDVAVMHRGDTHDLGPEVQNIRADRADIPAVVRIMKQHAFDAVLDFAYDWQKGTTADDVTGFAHACTDSVQRYLFTSSVAAYVPGVGLDEDAPLLDDDVPNPYGVHKASAERALFGMHAEFDFPVVTFRPPFVHGPRQPFYREQFFWDRMRDNRPIILPDGGETPMAWVFVSDVADAYVRALTNPGAVGEAFNIAHDEHITQRTFVEALGRAAGVTPELVAIPRNGILAAGGNAFAGNLYFGEYLDLPPITTRVEKARRVLGFEPTPLDDALRAGYEWYLTQPRRPVDYAFEDRLLATAKS